MRARDLVLGLMFVFATWLVPGAAHAELKLATLMVKGMVCDS